MSIATDTAAPAAAAAEAALRPMPARAGVLLMVDETHAEHLRQRFAARPVSSEEDKRRPELVARFPNAAQTGGYGYAVDANGIAVVSIKGAITPESWAWYDDYETISDWVERDLDKMADDPAVAGVLFAISSPGGYVAGSFEMADAIAQFAAKKPTGTFATGHCCSAAYLNAVGSHHITAYKTALVGSIGTRSAVYDYSEMFAKFGVTAIPLDSGGMKSAGLAGTKITPEQVEYLRGTVVKLQEEFTKAVAAGRGFSLEAAGQLADGRVHVAGDGLALGLIDAVGTLDQAYATVLAKAGKRQTKSPARAEAAAITTTDDTMTAGADAGGTDTTAETAAADVPPAAGSEADNGGEGEPSPGKETAMSQTQTEANQAAGSAPAPSEPKAATMAELIAACPGAGSDFLVEQAKAGATVAAAKDAYLAHLAAENRTLRERQAAAKEPGQGGDGDGGREGADRQQPKAGGVRPLEGKAAEQQLNAAAGDSAYGGDARGEFESRVGKLTADGRMSRAKAASKVFKEDPALREAINAA